MELRQLEYFAAVARHGNVTRAAEELWLTQSALSQQIRRLEAEVGVALLRRSSRGVEVTAAGADLLLRAEAILAEVARAREELDRHAGAERGRVRVAATLDALGVPGVLAAFHRAHPGIQLALRHAPATEVLALVQRGAADVGVAALRDAAPPDVTATPLAPEPLVVLAAHGDPLELRGGPVAVEDLRGLPLVLAEPGSVLRDTVVAACQRAGFSPVPLFEVSEPSAVRLLAASGLALSVVPASWSAVPGPDVVALMLEPRLEHRATVLTRAARGATAVALLAAALSEDSGQL